MSDKLLESFEAEAKALKGRDLTKDELKAVSEEMLKGTLTPTTDRRKRKNTLRTAMTSAGRTR